MYNQGVFFAKAPKNGSGDRGPPGIFRFLSAGINDSGFLAFRGTFHYNKKNR